jgi:hypothetical protein
MKDILMKFNCFLLGEDYNEVKNYQPGSKKKIKSLATTLLIPILTYFFTMFFISKNLFNNNSFVSFLCAFSAAFFIYVIEKSIVLVVPKDGWFIKSFILLLRLSLGLIISFVASIFIDQLIYKNEIDEESTLILKQNIAEKYDIPVLRKDMENKYNIWQVSEKSANDEADGKSGSQTIGLGKIAQQKIKSSNANELEYANAKIKYENSLNQQNNDMKNINEIISTSFLTRIKALENVLKKDNSLKFYRLGFTFLIILIESLVVIIKFSSKQSIDEFIQSRKEKLLIQKYSELILGKERLLNIKDNNSNLENINSRLESLNFN